MRNEAYWISPDGRILPVEGRHIGAVASEPERFGLTKRKIRAVYERHGEPVPFEGKARDEIMAGLLKKGWIRIRYRAREDSFTVQLFRLDAGARRRLKRWAAGIIGKTGGVPPFTGYCLKETGPGRASCAGPLAELMTGRRERGAFPAALT
jgi:hypothetical protein